MTSGLLNAFVGLVIGLATGFYFERRATKTAQREAATLARELSVLRESVYTMGAELPPLTDRTGQTSVLDERVLDEWIHSHQNAAGTLLKKRLFNHFLEQGYSLTDVSGILEALSTAGTIRVNEEWIEVL